MFLESSRYYKQTVVDTVTKDTSFLKKGLGRTVRAITLRRLSAVSGQSTVVKGNDRLDIMAQRQYGNPTMFWHIADANTELQANDLVREAGLEIEVPEQ